MSFTKEVKNEISKQVVEDISKISLLSAIISNNTINDKIIIDTEISFADLTQNFYNIICQMEPFGPENMRPIFCFEVNMINVNAETFAFLDTCDEQEINECIETGIWFGFPAMTVCGMCWSW